jgi:hypothetical protein
MESFGHRAKNPPLYKGILVGYFEKILKPPQPLLIKEGT